MAGFLAAWLVGEGIYAWRSVHKSGKPPVPGALLGVTALFAALAVVADVAPASRPVVTMLAWGLDIAGLLNVLPQGLSGQISKATATSEQAAGAAQNTTGGSSAG